VELVQAAEEEQIRDLLNDFQWIGNATGPESVPDAVDLIAQFACQHGCLLGDNSLKIQGV